MGQVGKMKKDKKSYKLNDLGISTLGLGLLEIVAPN